MAEPSAMMLEAFERLGCGSPTLTCYCGRVHHAPASDFIEPGEETQMRADAEKNPNSVQLHDGDGVSAMMIQGVPIVYGCKCNWLGKLEAIIWGEREYILKYYKLRRDAAAKDAQALSTALETSVPHPPFGECSAVVNDGADLCTNATEPGTHRCKQHSLNRRDEHGTG